MVLMCMHTMYRGKKCKKKKSVPEMALHCMTWQVGVLSNLAEPMKWGGGAEELRHNSDL